MKKVAIQGLGFVGSAMATVVSSISDSSNNPKFQVVGIDLNNHAGLKRIDCINKGEFPFETNDKILKSELRAAVDRGNLIATTDDNEFIDSEIILISINCDLKQINGFQSIDFESFTDSVKLLSQKISENTLVIIESTVPPGTCENIILPIFQSSFKERGLDIKRFFLAHSYERVMPGSNYFNSIINFWRVYAGINSESEDRCEKFLSDIINIKQYPLTKLKNIVSSEIGKVLENSYRAVNIAFIEEWGRFAEEVKVDLYDVIDAIKLRPTHSNLMRPGFGVGGYCLTKDPLFAKISSKEIFGLEGHEFPFCTKAINVNKNMPLVSLRKIKNYFNGNLRNKKILLMGISYRQDVGDTRFSPSEKFFVEAKKQGALVSCYDPLITFWEELNIEIETAIPSARKFDVVLFAVPHKDFKQLVISDWVSKHTLVFDANNVLTASQIRDLKKNNLEFFSIGRG